MSDPILSFKGLMQYNPKQGWAKVDPEFQDHDHGASIETAVKPKLSEVHSFDQVKTSGHDITRDDPLLAELFDQLHDPQTDDISTHWKTIAHRINLLSEGMTHQKNLREQLRQLDHELDDLRRVILRDLNTVQRVADHQLVQAKLRSEVSHLAHQRLTAHLRKD